jgi:hypothetical protein
MNKSKLPKIARFILSHPKDCRGWVVGLNLGLRGLEELEEGVSIMRRVGFLA